MLGRNPRMTFDINLGLFGGFWLASMALAVLGIRCSLFAARGRILTAAILSLSALTIGLLGSTQFHLTWTAWATGSYSIIMIRGGSLLRHWSWGLLHWPARCGRR